MKTFKPKRPTQTWYVVWKDADDTEIKPVEIYEASQFFIKHRNGTEPRHSESCDWFPTRKQAAKHKKEQLEQNIKRIKQELKKATRLRDKIK
jgi:hypothetical protein